LSITHHTRKRPSTGPRTTHGPQSPPLMSALTTPTQSNKREKKKKRNKQKETPTSDRKSNKDKEQDHLKKTSLGPLRQGQRLDTSETTQSSSKERKPPKQSSKKSQRAPPAHMQASPCDNPPRKYVLSPKTDPLWSLSNSKVSSCRWLLG
jgi:hypothetical protein